MKQRRKKRELSNQVGLLQLPRTCLSQVIRLDWLVIAFLDGSRLKMKNENRGESSAMTLVKSRIAEVLAPASSTVSFSMLMA